MIYKNKNLKYNFQYKIKSNVIIVIKNFMIIRKYIKSKKNNNNNIHEYKNILIYNGDIKIKSNNY